MNENRNILDDARLKEFPFRAPTGYFDSLEDRLRESVKGDGKRISKEVIVLWVKPAILLCAMFLIIAGLGLGASKLTGLLYHDPLTDSDPIFALIEEGYLDSRFIYSLYDEIDLEEGLNNLLEDMDGVDREVEETVERYIKEEELIEYLYGTEE